MTTQSAVDFFNKSSIVVCPSAPVSEVAFAKTTLLMSQTSTNSHASLCVAIASKWLAEIRPQPTSANLTFFKSFKSLSPYAFTIFVPPVR